jgi:hypothetical protein
MHVGPLENAPSRKPPISAAAILSASLLGLALAYCACTLMPLAAGHYAGAALPDVGSREGLCSNTERLRQRATGPLLPDEAVARSEFR